MKRMMICTFMILFVIILGVPQIFAQPTELKGVSFLPKDHRLCAMIPVWIDKVNGELKDSIKVNWLGGPEVMPPFEQPEAIRKGIFQIGFIPAAGSIAGSVLGATIYTVLLEVFRPLQVWRFLLMPLLLVFLMLYRPRGIMGLRELRWFIPGYELLGATRRNKDKEVADAVSPG